MIATHAHLTLAVVSLALMCVVKRFRDHDAGAACLDASRRNTVTARVFGDGGALLAPPLALMEFHCERLSSKRACIIGG